MKKKTVGFVAVAALGFAASASAQSYTVEFEDFGPITGGDFANLWEVGDLTGNITAIEGNFVLDDGSGGFTTWASDLSTMLIAGNDIEDPLVSQTGGFSNFGADEYNLWDDGNAGDPGTTVNAIVELDTAIDASTVSGWLGNGYVSEGNFGVWSGSITYHGASLVPAPGVLALLGVAGLVGVRRRRN